MPQMLNCFSADLRKFEDFKNNYRMIIYLTSCPGAPVALRHAASRHADRHYGQFKNIKYSTFRDPGG